MKVMFDCTKNLRDVFIQISHMTAFLKGADNIELCKALANYAASHPRRKINLYFFNCRCYHSKYQWHKKTPNDEVLDDYNKFDYSSIVPANVKVHFSV